MAGCHHRRRPALPVSSASQAATAMALTLTEAILLLNNWHDPNRANSLKNHNEYTDFHGVIRYQTTGRLPRQTDLDTANDRVERYAPDAPESVKTEAVVLMLSYRRLMGQGNITRDKEGDRELEFAVTRVNIFRHSGAMAMLTTYRKRRAKPYD